MQHGSYKLEVNNSKIMAVDLKKDVTGSYKLDSKQENCLRNKGYFPLGDSNDIEDSVDDNVENILCLELESTRTLMFWIKWFTLKVKVRKITCGCQWKLLISQLTTHLYHLMGASENINALKVANQRKVTIM